MRCFFLPMPTFSKRPAMTIHYYFFFKEVIFKCTELVACSYRQPQGAHLSDQAIRVCIAQALWGDVNGLLH